MTEAIQEGANTVVLRVEDPEDLSEIPHGKQGDPWYTRVSGPWQSIDLVTVPDTHVESVRVTPDLTDDTATVDLSIAGPADDSAATLTVSRDGETVTETQVELTDGSATATLPVSNAEYWTPETPVLYDLTVAVETMRDGSEADGDEVDADDRRIVDTYETYFGMRSVEYADGTLLLNGDPFVMRGALDQAFYPDTFYRPADLATFEREIKAAKDLGFNLLRKHIKPAHPHTVGYNFVKIFGPTLGRYCSREYSRQYQFVELADRLGILVWEEPANPTRYTETSKARLREQLFGLIERDYNSPSVVAWSIYNEEWGIGHREDEISLWGDTEKQDALESLYEETVECDPTRLVCDNSGWAHVATDLNDYHEYFVVPDRIDAWRDRLDAITANPAGNYADTRTSPDDAALLVSEFGTWGLPSVENLLDHYDGPPHWFDHPFLDGLKRPGDVRGKFETSHLSSTFDSVEALAAAWQRREFRSIETIVEDMRVHDGVAGYVLTELTDIEWEFNGVLEYLRSEKAYDDRLARVNAPVVLRLELSTQAARSGETVHADLVVVNDSQSPVSAPVTITAGDAETVENVTVPPGETARIADAVAFETPDVESISTVEATASHPSVEHAVTRSVAVVPEEEPPAIAVYSGVDPLGEALAARGYDIVSNPNRADVSVVTDPDGIDGPALVVPDVDGHPVETDDFDYARLPEEESWNLCASLLHQDLFDGLDRVPDRAFDGLYPYGYVTDVTDEDDIAVGYTEGWLENSGGIVLTRSSSVTPVAVCTLRVTETYGEHPIGTAVVEHLLADLAA